jgi:hypothetical protein
VGGLLWGFGAFALRIAFQWTLAKTQGKPFTALDRPLPSEAAIMDVDQDSLDREVDTVEHLKAKKGKFF